PSRECLASINLLPVSSGVGKFSAELDLVDSSTPPVRPITISGREFRSKPSANPAESHSPSRSFTNSLDPVRRVFAALSPPSPHRQMGWREKGTRVFAVVLLLSTPGVPISKNDFDRALSWPAMIQGKRHHSTIFERAAVFARRSGAGRTG